MIIGGRWRADRKSEVEIEDEEIIDRKLIYAWNKTNIIIIKMTNTEKTTIKRGAFLDCKNLKTLYLPDTFKMENNQEFSLTADLFNPENAQKLQEVREYLGLNEKVKICCSSQEKQTSTTPSKTKEKV